MKKLVLFFIGIISFAPFLEAQVQTPQASPHIKTEQVIGLTEITLEYSRPGVKGRTIFGGLVPYDKLWRTGANENTKITFSDDVVINGEPLEKGTYAIFTKPGQDLWQVYFYKDANNWGLPKEWDASKVALQTTAKTISLPVGMETFIIVFDNIQNDSAMMDFIWENTIARIKIEVPTEKKTMKSIEATMKADPTGNDYYAAASYYFSEGKDLNQALQWMEKAVKKIDNPPYFMLRNKSLLEAELGMKKAAIKSAQQSLKAAKKAEASDYVKMNKASLKEWGAM